MSRFVAAVSVAAAHSLEQEVNAHGEFDRLDGDRLDCFGDQ